MDYLVAGGNGFIGSNFITFILGREPDANVVNLDLRRNTASESAMELSTYGGRYSFLEGDIADLPSYEDYLKVSDVVINCATENSKGLFGERAERFVRTNIYGARVISDATTKYGVPLIHISTDEVYGACPEGTPRREESVNPDPSNAYSVTMAAGERLAMFSRKRSDVPLIILRPCELIGPNQSENWPVPSAINKILAGRPPSTGGEKDNRYRDWLHVLDLCSAMEFVVRGLMGKGIKITPPGGPRELASPGKTLISGTSIATAPLTHNIPVKPTTMVLAGDVIIFNVTAEMRNPILTVIEKVLNIMGSDLPIQESAYDVHGDLGYNPSSKKLKYHGWNPRYTDIDEVLRSTVEWYRGHTEVMSSVPSDMLNP